MNTTATCAIPNHAELEKASLEIARLRRKGVHCHIEERPKNEGTWVAVVREAEPAAEPSPR